MRKVIGGGARHSDRLFGCLRSNDAGASHQHRSPGGHSWCGPPWVRTPHRQRACERYTWFTTASAGPLRLAKTEPCWHRTGEVRVLRGTSVFELREKVSRLVRLSVGDRMAALAHEQAEDHLAEAPLIRQRNLESAALQTSDARSRPSPFQFGSPRLPGQA